MSEDGMLEGLSDNPAAAPEVEKQHGYHVGREV